EVIAPLLELLRDRVGLEVDGERHEGTPDCRSLRRAQHRCERDGGEPRRWSHAVAQSHFTAGSPLPNVQTCAVRVCRALASQLVESASSTETAFAAWNPGSWLSAVV